MSKEDNEVLVFVESVGYACQDPRTMGYRVLRHNNECIVQSWTRFPISPSAGGHPQPNINASWQQIGCMSASQFEHGVLNIIKKLNWEERYSTPGVCDGNSWSLKACWGAYEFESHGYVAKPADYDDVKEQIRHALLNQGANPRAKGLFARIHDRLFSKRQETPSTTDASCRRCIHCLKELPPFSKYCPYCGSFIGENYLVALHGDDAGSVLHDDGACSGTRNLWYETVAGTLGNGEVVHGGTDGTMDWDSGELVIKTWGPRGENIERILVPKNVRSLYDLCEFVRVRVGFHEAQLMSQSCGLN